MNRRGFTLSLVIAALAVFMVKSYIDGVESEYIEEEGVETKVVTARKDIKAHEMITEENVTISTRPRNLVVKNAIQDLDEIIGKTYSTIAIYEGEQLTDARVEYPNIRSGLSREIAMGKRAITIPVSEDQAVGKLIRPGDRVDVIAMLDYSGGQKEKLRVATIFEDVLILSTGLKVSNQGVLKGKKIDEEVKKLNLDVYRDYNSVTIELTPFEVQKLVFLREAMNGVYLSLRNNDDKEKRNDPATRIYDVLGENLAPEARAYFAKQLQAEGQRRGR